MFGEKEKKVVYIGADHRGFKKKNELKEILISEGYDVTDLGSFDEEPYDYPLIAREVSEKVLERKGSIGVLMCGTGIGVSIAANKLIGIRAVNAHDEKEAEMSRRHNDANVIAFGADNVDVEDMKKMTNVFLNTDFESTIERYVRRVKKIDLT